MIPWLLRRSADGAANRTRAEAGWNPFRRGRVRRRRLRRLARGAASGARGGPRRRVPWQRVRASHPAAIALFVLLPQLPPAAPAPLAAEGLLTCVGCAPAGLEGEHRPVVGGRWGFIDRSGSEIVPLEPCRREALAAGLELELAWPGHTPPDRWAESRLFHTPFDGRYEERVELGRADPGSGWRLVASPNRAYWAGLAPAGDCELRESGADCLVESAEVTVTVFTERERPLALRLRDLYPNFQLSLRWTSEKLLFVRVWWGRTLGSDLLVDVEREEIVYREMVHDGRIPFAQRSKPRGEPAGGRKGKESRR